MHQKSITELARDYRCVIYNDLSHIIPYYLVSEQNIHLNDEISFHKKNIYLLSLYFEKIIISTDNIAAFTRFTSKDIISKVVTSDWFIKLLESNVIVLCGWGTDVNNDMMYNQIEYSKIYRPELKEKKYLEELKAIAKSTDIVVREPKYGEKDHIKFLSKRIKYLEGLLSLDEVKYVSDLTIEVQSEYGFMGTMEIFPFIDDVFKNNSNKLNAFYSNYYQSWQEYSSAYYSPAITIDTGRSKVPARVFRINDNQQKVISSLYSPDFFLRFITVKLGDKKVQKILGVKPERLIKIRNGDWKVFLEKYHKCLQTAADINWIFANASKSTALSDPKLIDSIVEDIFTVLDKETDFSALGGLLDTLMGLLIGTSFLGPVFKVFRTKINKKLHGFADKKAFKEFEPFLKKLSVMLADSTAIQGL